MTDRKPKRVLMWGYTQVGKTALLTAAFMMNNSDYGIIDRKKSDENIKKTLFYHYDRLIDNFWIEPTSEEKIDLELFTKDGNMLIFSDIRGDTTRLLELKETNEKITSSDGILFVLEFGASDLYERIGRNIKATYNLYENKQIGLVFTKCELTLSYEDNAWKAEKDWWKKHLDNSFHFLEDIFGEAIWPTSVYGYDINGRPANILTEFGQIVPYKPSPKGIQEPFQWIIDRVYEND